MKLFKTILTILTLLFSINTFGDSLSLNDSIVAKVGTIDITAEEFVNCYEYGPAFYKKVKNSKRIFLEHLIKEKLLALYGYKLGTDTTSEIKNYIEAFAADIATEEMFRHEILGKINLSKEEIDTVAKQKLIDVEIQWLYSSDSSYINDCYDSLRNGKNFEVLYNLQLNDSIRTSDRSLKTTRYLLGMKNPLLGKIIDTLQIGKYSKPIRVEDGWYIILLKNFSYRLIASETEQQKLLKDSETALIKRKLDDLSNQYVKKIMLSQNPVIKRVPFKILRTHIGRFTLTKDLFETWQLEKILKNTLQENNIKDDGNLKKMVLVNLKDYKITLEDFINWYRTREQYIKYDKSNLGNFSKSLEGIIWRMTRDYLLSKIALEKGYYEIPKVKNQIKWWKDKIVFSKVKEEMINSIMLEHNEINTKNKKENEQTILEMIEEELTKKLFYKINELKKVTDIFIDEKVLASIKVSEEENPRAVDFYFVKRGNLIPRTPYPTIDNIWMKWQ
ncbi:hypothetical protein [Melioribacter sp. OK-6-Me]|uniref:hypothetical protein n=1 Tax=unclassified Melioribacter TaxID=2627329 RepID=UPI003EDA96F4